MPGVQNKQFPIQKGSGYPAGFIPWAIAEQAYETYAVHHGSQSLETLASRGGFGWLELIHLLRGRDHLYTMGQEELEAPIKGSA